MKSNDKSWDRNTYSDPTFVEFKGAFYLMDGNIKFYDSKLGKLLDYIGDIVQLNIYWLIGNIIGGILLGIFPSTFALVSVQRDRVYGKNDALTKSFIHYYKQFFWKANKEGGIFILGLAILVLYLRMSLNIPNHFSVYFVWLSYGLIVSYVLLMIYALILRAHLTHEWKVLFLYAIKMMILCPIHTVLLIVFLGMFMWSIQFVPMFLSVLSVALLVDILTRIIKHCQMMIIKVQRSKDND